MSKEIEQKMILDVTCGMRGIWFQKNEPHTIYCDRRKEHYESNYGANKAHRIIDVDPDIVCDFTDLPFKDGMFNLVVFDPPHVMNLSHESWVCKMYETLDQDWPKLIRDGFRECMRVLKVGGVLVFKWADTSIPTRKVIEAIGQEPLFGHRSGKKSNTHWMCFMKFEDEENERD